MKWRKIMILLSLSLLLTLPVFGAEEPQEGQGTCGENVFWELRDGILTISGSGPMEDNDFPWARTVFTCPSARE